MRGEAMQFNPEAGKPNQEESAEDAKAFEAGAEGMAAELALEDELRNAQGKSAELHGALSAKTAELLEASGNSDFNAVEAAAKEIEALNAQMAENDAEVQALADRVLEAKRLPAELLDISDAEIDAVIEELKPQKSEVEEALEMVHAMIAEDIEMEKQAKADAKDISGEDVDAAFDAIRTEAPAGASEKAKADTDWIDIDLSDLDAAGPEGPTEMGDDAEFAEVDDADIIESRGEFGEEMVDKWMAAGDAGLAADQERPIGTPDKGEIEKVLEKGELSPERKAALENEVQRLKNEVYELAEGIEYTNLDGDPIYKPGLKALESKLAEMGVDMEKMALSSVERAKVGFMGLFNRELKRTIEAYQARIEEFNNASENLAISKLQLEDPKRYVAVMQRRWLRAMETRMRMKARSRQKPAGGPFTMKF